MDTGSTSQAAPGDFLGNGAGNAANDTGTATGTEFGDRNIASSIGDFVDQVLAQQSDKVAAANDAAQGTDLGNAAGDTTQAGADLGLTHISGPWWWDSVNRKLIKIPGSGGAKKGTGKKVVPNTKKAGGKKTKPGKPKQDKATRTRIRGPKVKPQHQTKPKPHPVKAKVLPQPKTPRLTAAQRNAIDRAHHPAPKPPPKKITKAHKVIKPPVRHVTPTKPKAR